MYITLIAVPCSAVLLFLIWRTIQRHREHVRYRYSQANRLPEKEPPRDPYQDIEPLRDLDWTTKPPIKIRPFKPKYHLTMALENCPLSELIEQDDTFLERIQHRKDVMDQHPTETYQCNPVCESAVTELYRWMMGSYLPKRFPTMYRLVYPTVTSEKSESSVPYLINIPASKCIPLRPSSATEALYLLGENVDTDMLLLLPGSTSPDGIPIYRLQAYVTCFPAGFATQDKLGLTLTGIHKPVPGYVAKLEKSMDRFFAKLGFGRAVRRANWSISTNDKLYSQGGNHMYEDGSTHTVSETTSRGGNEKTLDTESPDLDAIIEEQKKDVKVEDCRLRCERQTLHRLPDSNALVFMFKTYQYPLADVKADGDGPELAEAIRGLGTGNVPDMKIYKRAVVWSDKVIDYLES